MAKKAKQAPKQAPANVAKRTPAKSQCSADNMIRARIARSTRERVQFHKIDLGHYVVRCSHGTEFTGAKRYTTARKQASPEVFCAKCAEAAAAHAAEVAGETQETK